MRNVWIVLLAVVMVATGVAGYALSRPRAVQPQLPQVTLPDLDGVDRSIRDWGGKPLLVNFWATWCPPCRKEIPMLIDLMASHGGEDLQIVGIAIDDLVLVREYAASVGINYPILVGEQDALDAAQSLGVDVVGLPITAFIDRSGKVVQIHQGELTLDQALEALAEIRGRN